MAPSNGMRVKVTAQRLCRHWLFARPANARTHITGSEPAYLEGSPPIARAAQGRCGRTFPIRRRYSRGGNFV